ncbi:MAG: glutamate racemase [Bacteroidales bacterium]|nr:glutamate racemase [Bacteroidales bacterium]
MGKNSPIGIFDSGVGGLTVAHALNTLLPAERMIYYGDTAHLPYGDKSKDTIVQYSLGIADFLLKQKCKVILIACNSASANAFDEVKAHVGDRAVVMNVIDPVVKYVCSETDSVSSVGIIGTKATIDSGTYEKKIAAASVHCSGGSATGLSPRLQVSSLATPLFVPMIEEGFVFDDISNAIIRSYLSRKELEGIESLILGCTHYPIIRNQISRFFNFEVNVHDTSQIIALAVQKFLTEQGLLSSKRAGIDLFYVSDTTPYFEFIANMFFTKKIHLEKKSIWK